LNSQQLPYWRRDAIREQVKQLRMGLKKLKKSAKKGAIGTNNTEEGNDGSNANKKGKVETAKGSQKQEKKVTTSGNAEPKKATEDENSRKKNTPILKMSLV
jgi:hypothetical protein